MHFMASTTTIYNQANVADDISRGHSDSGIHSDQRDCNVDGMAPETMDRQYLLWFFVVVVVFFGGEHSEFPPHVVSHCEICSLS